MTIVLLCICTFTCYKWLALIDMVQGYNIAYKWFNHLKQQGYGTIAYVIVPNHVRTMLYFPNSGFDLNKIIGNAKRFIAYAVIQVASFFIIKLKV